MKCCSRSPFRHGSGTSSFSQRCKASLFPGRPTFSCSLIPSLREGTLPCPNDRRTLLSGGAKLTLSDETGDFKGGLILRRGNIEVNCTAELLVELARGDMSAEIAGLLFG